MSDKGNYISVNSIDLLADYGIKNIVIAIGVFDGLHKGHQKLLNTLKNMAKKTDSSPIVLTFYPHPMTIINPTLSPTQLISQSKKCKLLFENKIDGIVTIPFTKDFSELSAKDFIEQCLASHQVKLNGICVGKKWKFGANANGSINLLKRYAEKGHFDFQCVDELILKEKIVSSTRIRQLISNGLLEDANELLGRIYTLEGLIITGKHIATDVLEYPTANLSVKVGVIPPLGVYAGYAIIKEKRFKTAIAIGVAPTFKHYDDFEVKIEAHLFDFKGNLYNQELELELVQYIREERCFSSSEKLKTQIEQDIKNIKNLLQ